MKTFKTTFTVPDLEHNFDWLKILKYSSVKIFTGSLLPIDSIQIRQALESELRASITYCSVLPKSVLSV